MRRQTSSALCYSSFIVQEHGLDYQRLLDSSSYKEEYRADMIRWGEERRDKEPGYFCSLACDDAPIKPVWVVSDTRRPTDMGYFVSRYCTVTVRVCAREDVRRERGWRFTAGVDDAPSECALDNYLCDCTITNNGVEHQLSTQLTKLVEHIRTKSSSSS